MLRWLSPVLERTGAVPHRTSVQVLSLAACVAVLSACSGLADFLTPGQRGGSAPAMVSFQANVALAANGTADIVSLRVASSYLRMDASRVPIASQTIALTSAALQPVPIPVNVAACLADAARDGNSGSCAVVLELALVVNGAVVDVQTVGPLRLTPGVPADVLTPVTLFELASVSLTDGSGAPLPAETPLALTVGAARGLAARVLDSRGAEVTDRPVTWSSDAPSVASVNGSGSVTALAPGVARISASLGALSASVNVQVARPTAALTIVGAAGSGRGTVRSTPAGIDCHLDNQTPSGSCSFAFPDEAQVTLRSIPDAGSTFTLWGAACTSAASAGNCVVTMNEARQASARFTALRRVTIAATADADGSGRITGGAGLDCRVEGAEATGTCSAEVPDGTELTLAADAGGAALRQLFAGWSGCDETSGAACQLVVSGTDRMVRAGFEDERRLTVSVSGTGGGVVQSDPDIACTRLSGTTNGACEAPFVHGTVVTLTMIPDARSQFVAWGGACSASGSASTCAVDMTAARAVTATLARRDVELTLTLAGSGNGTVQLDGQVFCSIALGDNAERTCTRVFPSGTQVTLAATAGAVSVFEGFSGACSGSANCVLELTDAKSVRAEFAVTPVTIEMTPSDPTTGSGVVRSVAPNGDLLCTYTLGAIAGDACALSVNPFTPVQLQATSAPASALAAWGGECAGTMTLTCSIAPSADGLVSARFVAAIDVNMIVHGSTGRGTVSFDITGVPAQASCTVTSSATNTCRYSLPIGATGVFRGVALPGYQFVGFTGPCLEGVGPVPVCTYRGFGFVREIQAYFQAP